MQGTIGQLGPQFIMKTSPRVNTNFPTFEKALKQVVLIEREVLCPKLAL